MVRLYSDNSRLPLRAKNNPLGRTQPSDAELFHVRFKWHLAALRFQDAMGRHMAVLRKAGFNPDEPRDDHGRWTNAGGLQDEASTGDAGLTAFAEAPQFAADNQRQNKMVNDVVVRLELDKDQRQELHRAISGQGYNYQQILELAKEMFGK